MRVAFDTSVVVAGLVAAHPLHARAFVWLQAAQDRGIDGLICTHGLAETWATLTAIPLDPRITGDQARRMIGRLLPILAPVPLSADDYGTAVDRCVSISLRSGAIYDALHCVAAERVQADALLTFNTRDFERLTLPDGPRITLPPDPPEVRLTDP